MFISELLKCTIIQRISDFFHEFIVEIEIVHDAKAHGKHLLCNKQVPDIGSGIAAADRTITLGVDRLQIFGVLCILQVNGAIPCKQTGMASIPGRHNTVKEVYASRKPRVKNGNITQNDKWNQMITGVDEF